MMPVHPKNVVLVHYVAVRWKLLAGGELRGREEKGPGQVDPGLSLVGGYRVPLPTTTPLQLLLSVLGCAASVRGVCGTTLLALVVAKLTQLAM